MNVELKKMLNTKSFFVNKIGMRKCLDSKNFWFKKILGPKKCWGQICRSKTMLGLKNFGS